MQKQSILTFRNSAASSLPLQNARRRWRWWVVIAAVISILLGLTAMCAWHLHAITILQLPPGTPPTRYNTALAIVCGGLALLLLLVKGQRIPALGLSLVVTLIGVLTLIQYIFQIDLGIDQLLMRDYVTSNLSHSQSTPGQPGLGTIQQFFITIERPLPGRPAPNVAVGFTFLGFALLSLGLLKGQRWDRLWRGWQILTTAIAGSLATGTLGIGFFTLLGYFTRLGTAYTWRYLTGVSVLSAICLILLGVGVLLAAFQHRVADRRYLPCWFPFSTGFGVAVISLLLRQALLSWSNSLVTNLIESGHVSAYHLSEHVAELQTLLVPAANIVWLGGLLMALLVTGVMHLYQSTLQKTERLQQLNHNLAVMQDDLFREKELAQITLHSIGDAVITTNALGQIEYFNPVAESLTGWDQADVKGLLLQNVFTLVHEHTREPVNHPVEQALRENQVVKISPDTLLIRRDGQEIAIDDSAAPIRDRNGCIVGAVMIFQDVTHARNLARQVSWQASHDALTGLVNRRQFDHHLQQALLTAQEQSHEHSLLFMDLDRFKIVNDTCGHVAGDQLLRQVTQLLQDQIRKTDVLARLGGDEFAVLLSQCPLEQAISVAHKLRESIYTFRFLWEEQVFTIGVSIGLVVINSESKSLADLLNSADAACYAAKNSGRNRVHVFASDEQQHIKQQGEMRWVARITKALEENLFCLYQQPIAAIASASSASASVPVKTHCEVLLRLQDESGGVISPMAFIPAAERYNLMNQIDRWVVKTLFQNWPSLQPMPDSEPMVYAINLSGASVNDDQFIDFLQEQFVKYAVAPELICFEITETVAITNLTKARQFIYQLQALGCQFALDDFGSGMSSFTYLKNLPVNYLKIDGEFIKNIVHDSADYAMVEAITHIAQVMEIKTVAEFVENDAILEQLTKLEIDYAQGYGIAKPQPLI
jgi:diguanylate cyclase (GGDEF)-like protein/PAS domain S-box-containing protein